MVGGGDAFGKWQFFGGVGGAVHFLPFEGSSCSCGSFLKHLYVRLHKPGLQGLILIIACPQFLNRMSFEGEDYVVRLATAPPAPD